MSVYNSQLFHPYIPPSISQMAPRVEQPVMQPAIHQVVEQSVIQPVYVPQAVQMPLMSQVPTAPIVPQPVIKPLTPSPTYDKFIPPTPRPTTFSPENPSRIYQFYQQIPVIPVSIIQEPAYTTLTEPVQSSDVMPQYNTLSYV